MAGFGRIVDLSLEQFLTPIGDAAELIEGEPSALDHPNVDHRDEMDLYATRLLGAQSATWRYTGCDPDGIDMISGRTVLRLDFSLACDECPRASHVPSSLADEPRAACRSSAGRVQAKS